MTRPRTPETPEPSSRTSGAQGLAQSQALLGLLGQRYVQFYPVLAELTGSVKCALLLGQALYWTRTFLAEHPERESWFWHTARDWLGSTGLSRREQESARRTLVGRNFVSQRRAGMPARLHYKVNLDELGRGLAIHLGEPESAWQWDNARLRRLLGRPVAFFRPLATVSGSVTAGLYLSHLCMSMRSMAMRSERCAAASPEGWMDLPIQASGQRLCLGAKSLRNARTRLVSGGLVEERWAQGVPPRKLTRIAHRTLAHRLSLLKSTPADANAAPQAPGYAGVAESANPAMTIAPSKNGGFRHSRVAQSANQQWRNPPIRSCPKRQTAMAESAIPELPKAPNMIRQKGHSIEGLSTQSYIALLLPTTPIEGDGTPHGKAGSQATKTVQERGADRARSAELLWADIVPEIERSAAREILSGADPRIRQLLLDEWVGQRRNPAKQMPNPLAYLAGIVAAARGNRFVPTLALQVASGRQKQAEIAAARAAVLERPLGAPAQLAAGHDSGEPTRRGPLPEQVSEQLDEFRRKLRCRR